MPPANVNTPGIGNRGNTNREMRTVFSLNRIEKKNNQKTNFIITLPGSDADNNVFCLFLFPCGGDIKLCFEFYVVKLES